MQEIIEKYLSGRMDVSERTAFFKRLGEDAGFRNEYIQMKRLQTLLAISGQSGDKAYARSTSGRLWQKITERRKYRSMTGWLKYAAAVAVLMVGTWMLSVQYASRQMARQYTEIEVPKGQCVNLTLADGSKVWLSPLSKMKIPGQFNGKRRIIELDGEGYFAVARDEQRPFTVKTGKYDIQVLGTEFRVFAYSKRAEQFETCLVKGKVKVCSTEDEKEVVYLSPNEKVRLVDRRLVKSDSDLSEAEYTRQGIFSFRMKSLREILDYLNLWYGVDFTIQAPLDAEKRISGKFHQNSEVTIVLDALREIYDFNYREDNESSYVIYK